MRHFIYLIKSDKTSILIRMKSHEGEICKKCFPGAKSYGLVLSESFYLGKTKSGFSLFDLNGHDEILSLPFVAVDPNPADTEPDDSPLWDRAHQWISAVENNPVVTNLETLKKVYEAAKQEGYREEQGSLELWVVNKVALSVPEKEQSNY